MIAKGLRGVVVGSKLARTEDPSPDALFPNFIFLLKRYDFAGGISMFRTFVLQAWIVRVPVHWEETMRRS